MHANSVSEREVSRSNRPYLVHVKCTLYMGFHIGLYIQGFEITDGNNAENGNERDGFLHDRSLSQH